MKYNWQTIEKAFAGKCPVTGGVCLNPLCALGCIEKSWFRTLAEKGGEG